MTTISHIERETTETVLSQHNKVFSSGILKELLGALPHVVTILNDKRQIVYSNQVLLNQLNVKNFNQLMGKRPGEAINCIHSRECSGGCGTSESCKYCGAFTSIIDSMRYNRKVSEECRIITRLNGSEEAFDFEATASPFTWEGERFTIFSLVDISGLKRRRMLERIFFHDILNTAGNLKGLTEILPQLQDESKIKSFLELLKYVSNELVEEIEAQKQLTSAEAGELTLRTEPVSSCNMLHTVSEQFKAVPGPNRVEIIVGEYDRDITFESDKSLITRVLKNMLKNAIEASVNNAPVTIGFNHTSGRVLFYVHNNSHMNRDVQLQIFKRNFSTKGSDRGLGTYSMRLLGEKYLKGKVYFETSPAKGTTFFLDIPCHELTA